MGGISTAVIAVLMDSLYFGSLKIYDAKGERFILSDVMRILLSPETILNAHIKVIYAKLKI